MTVHEAIARAVPRLSTSTSPALDAELLLAHVVHTTRSHLLANPGHTLGTVAALRYRWLVERRGWGVPVAYLTGTKEFYGREFYISRATLVPRPETETLIDVALTTIRANGSTDALIDIGTGSGCIAVTLVLELPQLQVLATDISRAALRTARTNAARHGVARRTVFLKGSLLEPLTKQQLLTPTATIVANLPYLAPHEVTGELCFEPRRALVAGPDGLALYHALFNELRALPSATRPRTVLLEVHPPTLEKLRVLLKNILPESQEELHHDLAGRPRVLVVTLAKN